MKEFFLIEKYFVDEELQRKDFMRLGISMHRPKIWEPFEVM